MPAEVGKIIPELTRIEIAEDGTIWLIQNHFESDSVIEEMESSAHGEVIIDDLYSYGLDYFEDEEDFS